MRNALLFLVAILPAASRPASGPLSDRDFQQLMDVAVAVSSAPSEVQPRTTTVCVQRTLGPPLEATRSYIRTREEERFSRKANGLDPSDLGGTLQPRTGDDGADKSLTVALSGKAVVAHQTNIAALP